MQYSLQNTGQYWDQVKITVNMQFPLISQYFSESPNHK